MRLIPIRCACWASLGVTAIGLLVSPFVFASPPNSPGKLAPKKKSTEEAFSEVPAVPFLTLGLVRDPSVHKELRLNTQQLDGVQSGIAEVDESFWRLRDVPVSKCSEQLDGLLAKLRHNLKRELTASQLDRLDQIMLQARGWKALVSPEIAERLRLSEDQVSKVRKLLADVQSTGEQSTLDLDSHSDAELKTIRAKLRTADAKRFADVLTKRQQDQYIELLGKAFDLGSVTPVGCVAPELREVTGWINSQPVTLKQLRGRVVVVHFWAFGCINCIRNLPHYQAWHERFSNSGLTIIGIQTPETAAERSFDNLRHQVIERKIEYPVAFDAAAENWKAWGNDVWPSVYLIDKQGRVRNWWYGELNWMGATGEKFFSKRIKALLEEEL